MTKKKSPLSDEDRALWKSLSALIEPHKKTEAHRKKRSFKKDTQSASPAAVKAITKAAPKPDFKPVIKKKWQPLAHQPASPATKKHIAVHDLPEIADDIARQLKSKKRSIDARIDLHGMTQDVAHRKALAFINASHARGLKTVLIITGKGKNAGPVATPFSGGAEASHHNGVLQKNLPRWLNADATAARHIAGISPAPRELGGSGAFVVQLRRR